MHRTLLFQGMNRDGTSSSLSSSSYGMVTPPNGNNTMMHEMDDGDDYFDDDNEMFYKGDGKIDNCNAMAGHHQPIARVSPPITVMNTQFLGEEYSKGGCCFSVCNGGTTTTEKIQTKDGKIIKRTYQQPKLDSSSLLSLNKKRITNKDDDVLILTEGFNKISMEVRERALAELHGIAEIPQETPELIRQSLQALNDAVKKIKKPEKVAYEKALFLNPNYVENVDFRLLFLRAEKFRNIDKAAERLVQHFEVKLELFGGNTEVGKGNSKYSENIDCLVRDMTFDDLTENAKEKYLSAAYWYLDKPDCSGRRILFVDVERSRMNDPLSYFQVCFYNAMNALEDVQTQIHGAVLVIFSLGNSMRRPIDRKCFMESQRIMDAVPITWAGCHFCYEDKIATQIFPNPITLMQVASDTLGRIRFRAHHGSAVEMRYALVSYGIAANSLPLDADGHLIDDEFQKQATKRRALEARRKEQIENSDAIICPTNLDVLLGRGKPYQDYPGNVRFHQIIELHRPAYEATSRTRKSATIMEIVRTINAMGGRFLKKPAASSSSSSSSSSSPSSDSTTTSATTATSGTSSTSSSSPPPPMASPWVEVDFNTAHKKVKDYFNYKGRNSSNNLSSAARGNGNGKNTSSRNGGGVSVVVGNTNDHDILPSSFLEEVGAMDDEMI